VSDVAPRSDHGGEAGEADPSEPKVRAVAPLGGRSSPNEERAPVIVSAEVQSPVAGS
jgi:hypothetical protein